MSDNDNNNSTNSITNPSRETHNGLLPSVVIALAVGALLLLLSCFVRKQFHRFFAPKIYHTRGLKHPPEISKSGGLFNWIPYTIKYPERYLGDEYGGVDMVDYITFLRYCAILFSVIGAFDVINLIVNLTANGGLGQENQTSMGNVPQKSSRLYLHCILVAIFTFFVYYFLYRIQRKVSYLRSKHVQEDQPYTRSVVVTHIPEKYASREALQDLFEKMYGKDQITGVTIAQNTDEAEEIRKERLEMVPKYKRAYFRAQGGAKEEFERKGKLPCTGEKVEARQYWEQEIRQKDNELVAAQNKPAKFTKTAFITFASVPAALQCAQSRHHFNASYMKVYFAPDPNEIYWENLGKSLPELLIRYVISTVLLIALFLFWTIPVAFLGSFTNLESLAQTSAFSFLDFVYDIPSFPRGILVGFLPALVLIIFMALLPTIILKIFSIRAYVLRSDLERATGFAYWFFLLIYVFLIITIAGSATRAIQEYIDDPSGIPASLAMSLPSQALFYFNYVCTAAFISKGIFLLRVPGFIIAAIKTKLAKSEYEKLNANAPEPLPYHKIYATDLIVFTVGIVFSVMAPLVVYIVIIYYCVTWFVTKNYFIFIHKAEYDRLNMSKSAVTANIISLYIFILLMIGLFSINVAPGGFIALVALIITLFFSVYLYYQFHALQDFSPLTQFVRLEKRGPANEFYYRPPALAPPPMFEDLTRTEDDIESGVNVREEANATFKNEDVELPSMDKERRDEPIA